MFWTEIITFDRVSQIGFFRSVRFNFRDTWTRISDLSMELTEFSDLEWLIRLKAWDVSKVLYLVLGSLIIAIFWACRRYRRYFRILYKQWFFKQESSRIAPEYYLEMLDLLNRKGFEKQAAETPQEFVKRIQLEFDPPEPAFITQLYYRNRFGNIPLRSPDLSQVYGWLKELRR
jgi:hypothetical protein